MKRDLLDDFSVSKSNASRPAGQVAIPTMEVDAFACSQMTFGDNGVPVTAVTAYASGSVRLPEAVRREQDG